MTAGEPQLPLSPTGTQLGTVSAEFLDGLALVSVDGEHDLSTRSKLEQALERAVVHTRVIVDLSSCGFIDSTAITTIIKAAQTVHVRGGRLIAVIPPTQAHLLRVAHMLHLAEIFAIAPSRADALALHLEG